MSTIAWRGKYDKKTTIEFKGISVLQLMLKLNYIMEKAKSSVDDITVFMKQSRLSKRIGTNVIYISTQNVLG